MEVMGRIKKFKDKILNENYTTDIKGGDIIEIKTIFGREKDELKDMEKKYIGKIYIVDEIQDEETLVVKGGGTWLIDDVRKLSDEEVDQRKEEIDKIYSDLKKDEIYQKELNERFLENNIKKFKNYLDENSNSLSEKTYDLSNDEYEIKLSIKKID